MRCAQGPRGIAARPPRSSGARTRREDAPGRRPTGLREPATDVNVVCRVKRLVCVSNRISLPRRGATPGGLAVGVLAALRHTGGVWFGWSGETSEVPAEQPQVVTRGNIRFATIDLRPAEFDAYYNGYCNGTLWPLFHYFPDRFTHELRQYE